MSHVGELRGGPFPTGVTTAAMLRAARILGLAEGSRSKPLGRALPSITSPRCRAEGIAADDVVVEAIFSLSPLEWRALESHAEAEQLMERAKSMLRHTRGGAAARALQRLEVP